MLIESIDLKESKQDYILIIKNLDQQLNRMPDEKPEIPIS